MRAVKADTWTSTATLEECEDDGYRASPRKANPYPPESLRAWAYDLGQRRWEWRAKLREEERN